MANILGFLFFIVLGSALCAITEAAILSFPIIKARILYEQRRSGARDAFLLKQDIAHTVASIVILNNCINIVGSIFIGNLVALQYGNHWLGITSAVVTFVIIIFGEIIPKTIGERYKVSVSLWIAKPLRVLVWFLKPIVALTTGIAKPFMTEGMNPKVTEEEIRMMLKLGKDEGTVEMDEALLCGRVFKLNDVRAMHIMKPIEQIYALPQNKTLLELKDEIINSRYSRIAVYSSLDPLDIVGMVQQRALLREIAKDNYESKISDFMTEPIFVSWVTKADALLDLFRISHQHLFVVQDSKGKDIGLVSMEDVLEELFGEILDEKDYSLNKPEKRTDTKL
ncbi:MAG: HlyC/CorC family transporter [Candidatus Omnitrophica bacterium]|nr:HlyC/CorC family transporter [Candidatus Omnitrophota bacterium]